MHCSYVGALVHAPAEHQLVAAEPESSLHTSTSEVSYRTFFLAVICNSGTTAAYGLCSSTQPDTNSGA